jgi:hypothetical protein
MIVITMKSAAMDGGFVILAIRDDCTKIEKCSQDDCLVIFAIRTIAQITESFDV